MNIPSLNLRVAQQQYNSFPFRSHHHTTSSFGEFRPVFYRNLQVGDKLTVDVSDMIRTEPLIYPTYGEVVHKLHAFFVPYRIIMRHFVDFITGQNYLKSNLTVTPYLPSLPPSWLRDFFTDTQYGLMEYVGTCSNLGDIKDLDGVDVAKQTSSSSTVTAYRFTRLGRQWLKIFNSLGYSWNWVWYGSNTDAEQDFNGLNLLSFMQIYLDYFCPSDYVSSHPFNRVISAVADSDGDSTAWLSLLASAIVQIRLPYDLDYYTSAWEKFNAPIETVNTGSQPIQQNSDLIINVPYPSNSSNPSNHRIDNTDTGIYIGSKSGSSMNNLSSLGIKLLEQVANLVNRTNFAGQRSVEKLLAKFGIRVPEYTLNRCVYLGSNQHLIQISDIQNLAESEYAQLGDYGGRMIGAAQNQKFSCEAKEYGVFMIVATIMPKIDYFQGYDKFNVIHDRFQFYTPEFAKLGNDAIEVGELYSDFAFSSYNVDEHGYFIEGGIGVTDQFDSFLADNNNNNKDIFGYMQRYANFKVGRSFVTGDYRIGSLKRALEPFHLNRILTPFRSIRAKGSFLYVDPSQYDRIFSVKSDKVDQFYPIYFFDCQLLSKMESFGDSLPITDGQGTVNVNMGGSQLN